MRTMSRSRRTLGGVVAASAFLVSMAGTVPAHASGGCGQYVCTVEAESTSTETTTTTTTTPAGSQQQTGGQGSGGGNAAPVVLTEAQLEAIREAQHRAEVRSEVYNQSTASCGGPAPSAPCPMPDPARPAIEPAGTGTTTTTTTTTVSVEEVVQRAKDKLVFAQPEIGSAPCTDVGCQGTVGVPVWLWTQDVPTQSATASVGGTSITVTDEVTHVTWDLGDGTTITCTSPGTPYDTSMGWASSPDCGVPGGYTQAGHYTVTATMHHDITWSGDASGSETATTSASTDVTIGEYQAIGVQAGS